MDDTDNAVAAVSQVKTETSDLRSVPKFILKDFIDTYRSHPALWQIKNKQQYNNRNLKAKGYAALKEVWKRYDPQADVNSVKSKVQSLRGSFRKELKKVEKSQRSGSGTEEAYSSHLWYFNMMHFLRGQELPTSSMDNIGDPQDANQDSAEEAVECSQDDDKQNEETNQSTSAYNNMPEKKRKRNEEIEQRQFMSICMNALNAKTDEFEAFGQYIGTKLAKVNDPEQRMFAETLVTKVINKAILNRLNEFTDITENFPSSSSSQSGNYQYLSSRPIVQVNQSPETILITPTTVIPTSFDFSKSKCSHETEVTISDSVSPKDSDDL